MKRRCERQHSKSRCERQHLTSSTRRRSLYVTRLCRKIMPWGKICYMKCHEDECVIWNSGQMRHYICKDTYVSDAAMKRHRLPLVVKHLSWVIAHVSMSPRAWVCQTSPSARSGGRLQPSAAARPPKEDHWSEDSKNVENSFLIEN